MKKLFMIYVGGNIEGANIEVHDVQFCIAESIEETFSSLRQAWFGCMDSLHIDCYKEINYIDGHKVSFNSKPSVSDSRLYFLNAGGYLPYHFGELHRLGLIVEKNDALARRRFKRKILTGAELVHVDNQMEVESCKVLDCVSEEYVHLEIAEGTSNLNPDWYGYLKVGRN